MNGKTKSRLMKTGTVLCAAAFLISGVLLIRDFVDQKSKDETFAKVAELVNTDNENGNDGSQENPKKNAAYEKYSKVYEKNNDFVGWISISGTRIDYPVMQSKNKPNFYLNHDFEKAYSRFGVPYMQENCDIDDSDNLVIYGHHMYNGSMFSDLCKYVDEEFYNEHKTFRFDTMESFGEYEIIAAFKTVAYSDESFRYDHFVRAAQRKDFEEYVAKCKDLSFYDTGVSAEYGDRLISLSTCEFSRKNGRMVIVAKRTGESS